MAKKKRREEAKKFPIDATCPKCGSFFGCNDAKGMVMTCGCGEKLTWNNVMSLESKTPFSEEEFLRLKRKWSRAS